MILQMYAAARSSHFVDDLAADHLISRDIVNNLGESLEDGQNDAPNEAGGCAPLAAPELAII